MTHNPRQAATFMVLAMLIIGLIDNYIAVIARDISLWQFQFVRACVGLPMLIAVAWLGFGSLRPIRLWAVLLRNGLVAIGMLFYFGSLAFMPIAQALAGLFTAPIFVLLISVFAFGEKVGTLRVLAVLLGFAGIVVVLGPGNGTLTYVNFLPVFGGLFYAMGSVATQRICAGESTIAMLAGLFSLQGLFGLLALGVLALWAPLAPVGAEGFLLRGFVWPTGLTWVLIFVQAIGSLIGVGFLIRAYQSGEPSFVAVFEYSVFIFGPLFAYLLFGQGVSAQQMIGIAMIAGAGSLIALRSDR
ncbi:DMT family transporter [Planktotalea arctica]|uniref:DMT family transporter n=1 Tax=Planktotalea arctica TaxID=1481893 RepID=UPI00321A2830